MTPWVSAAAVQAAVPGRPSAWWWLLPPVMYVLHCRWYKAAQQAMLAQLTETQREQMTRFQSKATGWFTVAAGAALLAAGDTWHVVQQYGWPVWLFWLLVAVMLAVAVIPTAIHTIGDYTRQLAAAESARARGDSLTPPSPRSGALDEINE